MKDSTLLFQNRITGQFDSYCKKVIVHAYRDCLRQLKKKQEREINFSDLSPFQLQKIYDLSTEDVYDEGSFELMGSRILIQDEWLFEAMKDLSAEARNILILSFYFNMSDSEIAKLFSSYQQAIYRKKTKILAEIRRWGKIYERKEKTESSI